MRLRIHLRPMRLDRAHDFGQELLQLRHCGGGSPRRHQACLPRCARQAMSAPTRLEFWRGRGDDAFIYLSFTESQPSIGILHGSPGNKRRRGQFQPTCKCQRGNLEARHANEWEADTSQRELWSDAERPAKPGVGLQRAHRCSLANMGKNRSCWQLGSDAASVGIGINDDLAAGGSTRARELIPSINE